MHKAVHHASKPECARFILEAAKELLAQVGYGAMSMRRLASHVGMLPGSLYHHVADKQELLFCVLLYLLDERDAAWAKVPRCRNTLDELRNLISFLLTRQISHPCESTILDYEARHLNDDLRCRFELQSNGSQTQLRRLIQRGVEEGLLDNIETESASLAIISLVKSAHLLLGIPGEWTPSKIENIFYQMILRVLDIPSGN